MNLYAVCIFERKRVREGMWLPVVSGATRANRIELLNLTLPSIYVGLPHHFSFKAPLGWFLWHHHVTILNTQAVISRLKGTGFSLF